MRPGQLTLGRCSAGQLTLTAVGGPVSWSASTSSAQVALSSQQSTLQAGQSVTLVVTVTLGGDARGHAFVLIDSAPVDGPVPIAPRLASQAVEVTWAAVARETRSRLLRTPLRAARPRPRTPFPRPSRPGPSHTPH